MSSLRRNWVVVFFILAVVGSYVVNNQESARRDATQHAQIVQTCARGSARIALIANGQFVLARNVSERGNPGDAKSAARYMATGRSLVETLPAPSGLQGSFALADVDPIYASDGKTVLRYQLTKRAIALQTAGCERVNN